MPGLQRGLSKRDAFFFFFSQDALKDKLGFAEQRRGGTGPLYRQAFHITLLGFALPFLCIRISFPALWPPSGSLEHCHQDSDFRLQLESSCLGPLWAPPPTVLARVKEAFSFQSPH